MESLRQIILEQGKTISQLKGQVSKLEKEKKNEVETLRMALYENSLKAKFYMEKCKQKAIATAVAEVQRERSRVIDDYEGAMEKSLAKLAQERDEAVVVNDALTTALRDITEELDGANLLSQQAGGNSSILMVAPSSGKGGDPEEDETDTGLMQKNDNIAYKIQEILVRDPVVKGQIDLYKAQKRKAKEIEERAAKVADSSMLMMAAQYG
mmetsp:Transcript_20555/g.36117  ORF Transcript_20555/g.36117 Transcript_20555/m.36117 type:complete len:210 (+) Transcript_20555:58-687(+)